MTVAAPSLSVAELEGILARTDPAVLLVPPRILRRVIKKDRGAAGLGLQVPHYKTYVIGRDALLRIAERDELDLPPDRILPETIILLSKPDAGQLQGKPADAALLRAWRLLFHARVHVALAGRALDETAVLDRVRRLGTVAFDEVRSVLRQEHFLLPPGDDRTIYEEFAAVYLELRCFARHLLPRYFPAIADFDAVDRLLAEDVDADDLFARTRPEGAPLPEPAREDDEAGEDVAAATGAVEEKSAAGQTRRAERAAERGNDVRAARLHCRAGQKPAALECIRRLTNRLQKALEFPAAQVEQWRSSLAALLESAARGLWPVEARLLYDLQRACIDAEKDIYAVDFVEWAVTWGQKPIKRLLTHQPFVLTVKYLRRCLRRLTAARLSDVVRQLLHRLLEDALHDAEKRLRERFRPLIHGCLDDVDLRPANYPESVARDTVVEEMLDRVVERGFLTMGDLRDAIARNRLKLADISNPLQVLRGDKLIKANRKLALALDGVYRRGEIYLRWLQRLSSVFFGTAIGRFLVLYLILPLGGAFVVLEGLGHLIQPVARMILHLPTLKRPYQAASEFGLLAAPNGYGPLLAGASYAAFRPYHLSLVNRYSLALGGLFLFGMLHSPRFRRIVLRLVHAVAQAVWLILYDVPTGLLGLPLLRRIFQSRAYLLLYQFLLKPLFWAVAAGLLLWLTDFEEEVIWIGAALTFAAAEALVNSRAGLRVEELCTDGLVRGWHLVRMDLIPGMFRWILAFFKWLVEGVDRLIYTVDEWLRFRTGDSRLSLVVKPVVGLVWFCVTYVVRFAVNILIEPQINPIKHFPVVTVSHKLLLPMVPTIADTIGLSIPTTTTLVSGVPGIFGFLVWELKENWKLYKANQPDELLPVIVGSHGETMVRLLRPGFHSGTLPKLYSKLRRFERRHQAAKARARREELHHVEQAVRHFTERGLVAVLTGSRAWSRRLFVGTVHAATNQIRIEIGGTSASALPEGTDTTIMRHLTPESTEIVFETQSGWLVAGVSRPGWIANLGRDERAALVDVLAGFYKLAGADLVREQVADALPAGAAWSVVDDRLVVWREGKVTRYGLADEKALPLECVLFSRTPLRWADWLAAWQRDQDGKGHEPPLLPGVPLLA